MKRILLIGIFGTYNYGCEAIVRGTVTQIRQQYPDAYIAYASMNIDDDIHRLRNCNVNFIDSRKKNEKFTIHNIVRKICKEFGVMIEYTVFANIKQTIKMYDVVISIGGDMYTLSPSGEYSTNISCIGNKCRKYSIPYIIWGCSIGPFESNLKAKKYYIEHLKNVTKIVAREYVTTNYLKNIGIYNNVVCAPDPAFYVTPMEMRKNVNVIKKIGVNLSPHSASYHYSNVEQAISVQANEINRLIEKLNCEIVLLPHVVSHFELDNDYIYLDKIRKKIGKTSKVTIVNNDPGFVGIKKIIKDCDVVIASRMHCNINAVTCGVPTIFLAYSQKAIGMVDFVYKDTDLLIDIKNFNADLLVDKIKQTILNEYNVKEYIENYDIKSLVKEIM